jgi:folate-binding Fe-S cluster repair protein YgfZ
LGPDPRPGPDARSLPARPADPGHAAPGPRQARLAGYCSAKGRLLATFVVWQGGDDEVLLACSADLLPATLKRLSMFVLRAKCKLSDAGPNGRCGALAGRRPTLLGKARRHAGDWQVVDSGSRS